MDYSKTAAGVLKGVGGEENVQSLVHCATRLRFVIKDTRRPTRRAREGDARRRSRPPQAGGQYQVVIGNDVPEVYAEIGKISKLRRRPTSRRRRTARRATSSTASSR